jgi:hypothetical protein
MPLFHHVGWVNNDTNSHSFEQDTQPTVFLINREAVSYRTHGGTCCPVCLLLRFGQITFQPLLKPQHRSSHDQITSQRMEDHISHTKTQVILDIIMIEDLHGIQDCRTKQNYQNINPNPKCIKVGI